MVRGWCRGCWEQHFFLVLGEGISSQELNRSRETGWSLQVRGWRRGSMIGPARLGSSW